MDELEKKAADIQAEIKATSEGLKNQEAELKTAVEKGEKSAKEIEEMAKEVKSLKDALETKTTEIKALDEALNTMNTELKKKGQMKEEGTDFQRVIESAEFKSQLGELMAGKRSKMQFEVKDDPTSLVTANATNPVARTMMGTIYSAAYEPNKFINAFNPVTVPQDKNRAMWFDGVYYSNVGYMSELTAITTGDGGTIEEKYREIAKIGAKLPFSAEVASDMSYFLNWYKNEGVLSVNAKIDELLYAGVGADGGAYTKNIYGMKTQGATAFSAATAGLALAIPSANIADLIRAAATQIRIQSSGRYNPNAVFLHPSNVALLYTLKNSQADYISILPNGAMSVYGINILETTRVAATEMLLVDTSTMQLFQKGGLELEVTRYPETDSYVMYIRWRGQAVVPAFAKLGNIFVSNITTAIAAISSGATVIEAHITNNPLNVFEITTTTTAAVTTTTTAAVTTTTTSA